ncbi:MAG: hypothetical protein M0Z66_10305 [Thermaerobacter sp.]|nr:hypothetical protein [Thermaerobacter sp.]
MKGALNGLDLRKFKTWLIVGVAAAVLLLLSGTLFGGSSGGGGGTAAVLPVTASQAASPSAGASAGQDLLAYQRALSSQLSTALSGIQGAGHVTVSLDLRGGPSYLYAFNQTTRKTDTGTGTSSATTSDTTNETQLATAGSGQTPVLTQEVAPRVVGVLIVATGANNPMVRQELTQAAEALLGLPAYTIEVLPGGGGQ